MLKKCKKKTILPIILLLLVSIGLQTISAEDLVIDRGLYKEKLRGFWLAQSIGNWTGIQTEYNADMNPQRGRSWYPYLTEANWGNPLPHTETGRLDYILNQDPWKADDDTDIEYIYQHLLYTNQTGLLTGKQIKDGWIEHIWKHGENPNHKDGENFLWCSNQAAHSLMFAGVEPPKTSLPQNNTWWEYIDAQLTTEIFGLFAPGRTDVALEMAKLPIRTSAFSHSEYAAEFYVIMHSLASSVDKELSYKEQLVWLADQARLRTNGSSYIAVMYDWVKNEYRNNPVDWQATRDKFHDTFLVNGYGGYGDSLVNVYDCGINFGASIISLLYGEGDLKKTIKIGTLCGWDSDNPTATWSGLLGFIYGYRGVEDHFEKYDFSDRYHILRTRKNFPDYLPGDDQAEDTFTLMSERALEIIDRAVIEQMGGTVDMANNRWIIPDSGIRRFDDGNISPFGTVTGSVLTPVGGGNPNPDVIRDNLSDVTGGDNSLMQFDTYTGQSGPAEEYMGYTFEKEYSFKKVVFTEGKHFENGGWFANGSLKVQVRQNGHWIDAPVSVSPLYPAGNTMADFGASFETYTFMLDAVGDGIRLIGNAGGTTPFISVAELAVYDDMEPVQRPFSGLPLDIPSQVLEAENYDLGGKGIAYFDNSNNNEGGEYRLAEGVDIQELEGGSGYNMGWTQAGEWFEYTVDIENSAEYDIVASVASESTGGQFTVAAAAPGEEFVQVADFQFGPTGGWQNWSSKSRTKIVLESGVKIIRIFIVQGGFNLDKLQFKVSGVNELISLKSLANGKYVCADNFGNNPLIANRDAAPGGGWEEFTLERNGDGTVSLKASANGLYVSVQNGILIANSFSIGTAQKFYLDTNGTIVSFKSAANGKYVCADNFGNNPLIANRDAAGGWEQFEIEFH